jgi:hypothetical protein
VRGGVALSRAFWDYICIVEGGFQLGNGRV